jgi:hypothetical protein
MFKHVNIFFISAANKTVIGKFKNLSVEEANLMLPTDGFLRYDGDWKVRQIIKEIQISPIVSDGTTLVINVYLDKITSGDCWLL